LKTIGNPTRANQELVNKVKAIKVSKVRSEDSLRLMLIDMISYKSKVLDCGKSLREVFDIAKNKSEMIETLDINSFGDYPDYLIDVCDKQGMKFFQSKYDLVVAFSLIEHCYNPFLACENLFSALKRGGKVVGSAPFLFPRHGPEDLSYQDFFRFTRDSYAVLFPRASNIELFPLRGRLATGLNVLSLRYRFSFEKRFKRSSTLVNNLASSGSHGLQSSGYGFIISN
jgi:hypothetical protein